MRRFSGNNIAWQALLGFLCTAGSAAGQTPLVGHWEGVTLIQPAKYEVAIEVDFSPVEGDAPKGSLSFTTNSDSKEPIHSLLVQDRRVRFAVTDEDGVISSFDGWLSDDGSRIAGDLEEGDAHYLFNLRRVDRGKSRPAQPALRHLSKSGAELKELFNRDRSRIRLLAILSPSCPLCKSGVGVIQRYLLDEVTDPRLAVYVIWEQVIGSDTQEAARAASRFIDDPRVAQFWAEDRFTGQAFEQALGAVGSPVWDVYLLFADGQAWSDAVPAPSFLMSNLVSKTPLPDHPRLDGVELGAKVKSLLASRGDAPAHRSGE
jgi:hypothetical protein